MRIELGIDPDQLELAGNVTVKWSVEEATTVLLSDHGAVPATGSKPVQVRETTTFVLTAFDAARGRVACDQKTVTVLERAPRGLIVPWWGDGREPPEGWVVCDGENDTPDLRGRFVRGARDDAAAPHRIGESDPHGHTLDLSGIEQVIATEPGGRHTHALEAARARRYDHGDKVRSVAIPDQGAAGAGWDEASGHEHRLAVTLPAELSSDSVDPRPPWVALHYLMRR